MKLLLTGATGFVGKAVVKRIALDPQIALTVTVRNKEVNFPATVRVVSISDLSSDTRWVEALDDVDVVVHLAGRAHVLKEKSNHPLVEFRRVNVEATVALAKQALDAGVKRFVFVSSIGVNGNGTMESVFTEDSVPAPHADYALSKLEAEQCLLSLLKDTTMELVIIRPPLVYASNAPGNFSKLLRLVALNIPLPFGSVHNQRSMIALENLSDFIVLCSTHPSAAGQLFLVSDGVEFSTSEIVEHLAEGMGKKLYIFPVPVRLLRLGASIIRKKNIFEQLCGSLVVDSNKARNLLGWCPPINAVEALKKAGRDLE